MKNKTAFSLLSAILWACGPDQLKAVDGQACTSNQDCRSNLCVRSSTQTICVPQTCKDGNLSGQETDIDCGSACNVGCNAGQRCSLSTDCANNYCFDGRCVLDNCTNGTQDIGETDIDCGGVCPPCGLNQNCSNNKDCQSTCCQYNFNTCISDTDRGNCK